jgi:hypothetical protein
MAPATRPSRGAELVGAAPVAGPAPYQTRNRILGLSTAVLGGFCGQLPGREILGIACPLWPWSYSGGRTTPISGRQPGRPPSRQWDMSGRMQSSKQGPISWMDRGSCRGGFQTRPGATDDAHPVAAWYYEHVIRNEKALDRIRAYIANNPARWAHDPENISRAVSAEAGRV